ncbi:MAG: hypothetical protein ACETWM_09535 [Candidatus Lokiarchaeia archaeon]
MSWDSLRIGKLHSSSIVSQGTLNYVLLLFIRVQMTVLELLGWRGGWMKWIKTLLRFI